MRSARLVFNPASGRGDAESAEVIQQLLSPSFDVRVCTTDPELDADHWARRALEAGADVVIAAGGDGTVGAVASVLRGTGVPLAVIPRGTANALSVALGLPQTAVLACAALQSFRVQKIDAGLVNGQGMIMFAGVGFHADTIENTSREAKSKLGYLAYLVAGIQQLSQFKEFDVEIETEDRQISCRAIAVTVANIAPPTTILAQGPDRLVADDGLLDVTIVAASGVLEAVATGTHLLLSANLAKAARRDNIGWLRAKRVRVATDPVQTVVVDGDVRDHTPFVVECVPGALSLCVPSTWQARSVAQEGALLDDETAGVVGP